MNHKEEAEKLLGLDGHEAPSIGRAERLLAHASLAVASEIEALHQYIREQVARKDSVA